MTPPLWTPRGSHSSSLLPTALDRRTFLRGAGLGLAGLAGAALLGCSDDGGDEPAATAATGASTGEGTAAAGGALEKTELRVGYLPITDSTPLVLAHGLGYYEEAGLKPSDPTLFRGWSQVAEAFQARQVDVVHLLMPMAIWAKLWASPRWGPVCCGMCLYSWMGPAPAARITWSYTWITPSWACSSHRPVRTAATTSRSSATAP